MSKKSILIICTSCLFITSIALSSYTLFLIPLQQEFNLSRSAASLPFTIAMISWGIFQPVTGIMADKYGSRRVIISGIILMLAGYAVMGFARSYIEVVLGYGILTGMSISACGTTMFSLLVSKHYSSTNRTLAVSISQTASPGNPIIFGPLLFWIIINADWRAAAFTISALLLFLALPLAVIGVRDPLDPHLPAGGKDKLRQPSVLQSLAVFRNSTLQKLMLARFACGLGFILTSQMVPIAISNNFSEKQGAFALLVYGASAIVWVVLGGLAADRFGRSGSLAVTYFLRGLGALGLAIPLLVQVNQWTLLFFIVLSAGPIFATISINNVMIFETVGPKLAGMTLGLSFTLHQVAAALSTYLGGLFFDIYSNYQLILLSVGIISMAAGVLVLTIKNKEAEIKVILDSSLSKA